MATHTSLTAALRANLLSLQGTASLLDTAQLRLSTGRKVNSALDSPTSFFTSQALNNRASDLSSLLDGMGQAIQTLTAAQSGITSLTTLVEQAKSIAQSAQDSLSNSGMARTGDYNAADVADITASGLLFDANDAFTIQSGTDTAVTITITAGMSLAALASVINTTPGFTAQVVQGSSGTAAGSKRLEIRATNATLTLANVTVGAVAILALTTDPSGISGRDGGGAALASLNVIGVTSNTPDQISLQYQYDAVRTQMDQLISDTGYRGTNLLNGDDLTTQFNEKNTSKQTVSGVTFDSATLGITVANNNGFRTAALIQTSLDQVATALTTIRSQSQTFGNNLSVIQTRQDFTKNLVNILKEGSDKLVLADKNEEGANLLALQTAQQLGIQALALASQANQSVLRLFQ